MCISGHVQKCSALSSISLPEHEMSKTEQILRATGKKNATDNQKGMLLLEATLWRASPSQLSFLLHSGGAPVTTMFEGRGLGVSLCRCDQQERGFTRRSGQRTNLTNPTSCRYLVEHHQHLGPPNSRLSRSIHAWSNRFGMGSKLPSIWPMPSGMGSKPLRNLSTPTIIGRAQPDVGEPG